LNRVVDDSKRRITIPDLELLQRCCDLCRAKTIVEIGSADGGSSIVLGLKAQERQGHLTCIEPKPKGCMKNNMARYGLDDCYTIIAKASPWVPLDLLPKQIDLLFIDGCHELRWVLADYHYFEPLVREGGIIIFHDTSGNCAEDKRRPEYKSPGYTGLVARAIQIVMETDRDKLITVDRSDAPQGGAIAFKKIK